MSDPYINCNARLKVRTEAHKQGWVDSQQHAASIEHLNRDGICPAEAFVERVRFRSVDMNRLPADLHVDEVPYAQETHLKLRLGPYVSTSFGIIVTVGERRGWFRRLAGR